MWPFKKKKIDYTPLLDELYVLSREWFKNQYHDLADDEWPSSEKHEQDILQMRDRTFNRIEPFIKPSKAIHKGQPNDKLNAKAMKELVKKYKGYEKTTPIFTTLALSKVEDDKYQSGWPLCTIRLIAETWLEQTMNTPY